MKVNTVSYSNHKVLRDETVATSHINKESVF